MTTVTKRAGVATTERMPRKPRKSGMERQELRALLDANDLTLDAAAKLLGVAKSTVHRWLKGPTPIAESSAFLIRARIKKPK